MKKTIAFILALMLVTTCIATAFASVPACPMEKAEYKILTRGNNSRSRIKCIYRTGHDSKYWAHLRVTIKYTYVCGRSVCGTDLPFSVYTKSVTKSYDPKTKGARAGVQDSKPFYINTPHADDEIQSVSVTYSKWYSTTAPEK